MSNYQQKVLAVLVQSQTKKDHELKNIKECKKPPNF